MTHRKLNWSAGITSLPCPFKTSAQYKRILPRISQAFSHWSAANKIKSPSSIFNFEVSAAFSASLKNFTMGDFHSPFSTLMKARPFAPKLLAYSVIVSIWPCVAPAMPLALSAFTTPPLAIVPQKTLNVLARKSSVMSTSSIRSACRVCQCQSGSSASSKLMRLNGVGTSMFNAVFQTRLSKPSMSA